jgi:hypothetical protein
MNAGRKLDALVAEAVMGIYPLKDPFGGTRWPCSDHQRLGDGFSTDPPPYSTDIAAAWEVVDKFPIVGVNKIQDNKRGLQYRECIIRNTNGIKFHSTASTAPLAICLAALEAVGMEVT